MRYATIAVLSGRGGTKQPARLISALRRACTRAHAHLSTSAADSAAASASAHAPSAAASAAATGCGTAAAGGRAASARTRTRRTAEWRCGQLSRAAQRHGTDGMRARGTHQEKSQHARMVHPATHAAQRPSLGAKRGAVHMDRPRLHCCATCCNKVQHVEPLERKVLCGAKCKWAVATSRTLRHIYYAAPSWRK